MMRSRTMTMPHFSNIIVYCRVLILTLFIRLLRVCQSQKVGVYTRLFKKFLIKILNFWMLEKTLFFKIKPNYNEKNWFSLSANQRILSSTSPVNKRQHLSRNQRLSLWFWGILRKSASGLIHNSITIATNRVHQSLSNTKAFI